MQLYEINSGDRLQHHKVTSLSTTIARYIFIITSRFCVTHFDITPGGLRVVRDRRNDRLDRRLDGAHAPGRREAPVEDLRGCRLACTNRLHNNTLVTQNNTLHSTLIVCV